MDRLTDHLGMTIVVGTLKSKEVMSLIMFSKVPNQILYTKRDV